MAKIKVQKITGEVKKVEEVADISVLDILKEEAVKFGMPKSDADKFTSEESLRATVNVLKANQVSNVVTPVVESPKEMKEDEKRWQTKADRQKAFYDSQKQITVMIPLEPGEKPGVIEKKMVNGREEIFVLSGAVWSKSFNGYRVVVPKGVYTPVAEAIAQDISDELNQTMMAGERFKIDRIDPNTGQPVRNQLS